jgi:hypothetical protein
VEKNKKTKDKTEITNCVVEKIIQKQKRIENHHGVLGNSFLAKKENKRRVATTMD